MKTDNISKLINQSSKPVEILFQMAKRKIDCSLDEIVGEYLMKRKCEKSRKLFEENFGYHKNDRTKILENFLNYLKIMETKKEIKIDEDLDFEINFGAYQTDQKVSTIIISRVASPASFIKNYDDWSQIAG